jgi:hypothetical protein
MSQSYFAPHMVTFQEHSRFYSRNNSGKYPLDVTEIRSAFALSESLPERVRRFRDERLARIVADELPVPLPPKHIRFVLHVLPVTGLDLTARIDITPGVQNPHKLRPLMSSSGFDFRFNLDGYLTFVPFSGSSVSYTYTQLFRNGAIEAVEGGACEIPDKPSTSICFGCYERYLIDGLEGFLKLQQELELQPPLFVLLALIGVKGRRLTTEHGRVWMRPHAIDHDLLVLPDVLVEDYAQSAAAVLRPIFDAVWQSAGWPCSPNYNNNGQWELQ